MTERGKHMKKELNAAIKSSGVKINEISLFRAMADEFNHSMISQCTYVEEIHGNKGMVEFPSKYKVGGTAKTELGDLLILTFDKSTKELRLCVLQAKYKSGRYYRFLNSQADIFQWELLHDKPLITNRGRFNFPSDILNFRTDYRSISAYGIFYHDNITKEVDFLYTLPDFFAPHSIPKHRVSNGNRSFNFKCPIGLGSPNKGCTRGITPKEAISTCSIDVFEKQVLLCKIGAPIPRGTRIADWVGILLNSMRGTADNPRVIEELLGYYGEEISVNNSYEETPSALVVVTDSERYKEAQGENMLVNNDL